MANIAILGNTSPHEAKMDRTYRKANEDASVNNHPWARYSGHIYTDTYMWTMLLTDSLRRLLPDANVTAIDSQADLRTLRKSLKNKDVNLAIVNTHRQSIEPNFIRDMTDASRTILIPCGNWVLCDALTKPEIIDDLNRYAAVFEHSFLVCEKLRAMGLGNVHYLPPYRIWTDEARAKASDTRQTRRNQGLRSCCIYTGVGHVKGHQYAIEAVKMYNKNHKDQDHLKLDIIGHCKRTPEDDRLRWLDDLIDGDANIRYAGELDSDTDIATLARYDAGVYPSVHEFDVIPATQVACLAAGLPMIATDWRYNSETVRDGVNGLLVPTCDSEAIARAFDKLASDPARLNEMGEKSRALHGCVFSESSALDSLVSIIKTLTR